ncbi:TIGR00255 family protein [Dethiosulfatibacter aminovorans DSM 17477]|uniref:TIGR00255 family protein n=1 Tax=Dethiosulfatibacter aminovorans DSM 17477 TaxID=1121476 RepID=A0A1M6DJ31_9FIRM|nr:YicC/YloC family endoribonuclease [Dethiosulfatibacter aminovorans]SHI73266.1 TIGR00255 family protein [Dethiosulfatibacter aminovorans DSM 17477]
MNFVSSMTGFGKGEYSNEKIKFSVETKTINNRYNDINIRTPKYIRSFEDKIRRMVKKRISRGRVDVSVTYEMLKDSDVEVKANVSVAMMYKKAVEELSVALNLEEALSLDTYLKLPDILEIRKSEENEDETWLILEEAVENSIKDLIDMRNIEGEELKNDIIKQSHRIDVLIDEIEGYAGTVVEEYKLKLENRINELLADKYAIDDSKLSNEIVFFADRADINEEIVRLRSHIKQLVETLDKGGVIGRKLDFILQEINREANTIASKSSSVDITQRAVEVKNCIERMREQVQNIE